MEAAFNFKIVDIFFLILCLRVVYSAVAAKTVREFFKVAGLLLGMLLAFHFYSFLGKKGSNIPFISAQYLDLISFLVIFFSVRSTFGCLGLIVSLLVKKKEETPRQKWVLLASGGLRSVLLASVFIFSLQLSPLDSKYFINSFSYNICKNFAPGTYLFLTKLLFENKEGVLKPNEDVQKRYESLQKSPDA